MPEAWTAEEWGWSPEKPTRGLEGYYFQLHLPTSWEGTGARDDSVTNGQRSNQLCQGEATFIKTLNDRDSRSFWGGEHKDACRVACLE